MIILLFKCICIVASQLYLLFLTFGVKLWVAAWDANLVTPHKRMGNAGISLDGLCDGENPKPIAWCLMFRISMISCCPSVN